MKQSARLIFLGTENFSSVSLEKLISNGWQIIAVITKPDSSRGRGQKVSSPKIKTVALENNIPVFQPEKITEIKDQIIALKPSHGILVSYGKIIPQNFIDIFPGGIINVHPSLLPKYRGPSPIEAAILNGDSYTGVSLMKLSEKMDAGPVYAQIKVPLDQTETKSGLYQKLSSIGAGLLLDNIEHIISSNLVGEEQNDADATYTKLLNKDLGQVDWSNSAISIERQVRAYEDYPKTSATIFDHRVVITKAKVVSAESPNKLTVKCGEDWLQIDELISPSGKRISGPDFVRGYKK